VLAWIVTIAGTGETDSAKKLRPPEGGRKRLLGVC
jgi:hypothetical protein